MLILAPNQIAKKYPYTLGDLRRDNPNTSFPKNPTDEQLAEWGVFRVQEIAPPTFNSLIERCQESDPVFQNGQWIQVWSIVLLSEEEKEQRKKDRADQLRGERDQRLMLTDWTQLSDSPVDKEKWAIYRQALRDLPEEEGFPYISLPNPISFG